MKHSIFNLNEPAAAIRINFTKSEAIHSRGGEKERGREREREAMWER
jgi:hypothetical protein